MKIKLDSSRGIIEDADNNVIINIFNNHYAFGEIVENILTPAQYNKYIGDGIDYSFVLSEKKTKILLNYRDKRL